MLPENHFEHILDEALELYRQGKPLAEIIALFPSYQNELTALLAISSDLQLGALNDAKNSLQKTLRSLPAAPEPKPPLFSFLSFMKLPSFATPTLAVLFITIFGVGLYQQFFSNRSADYSPEMSYSYNRDTSLPAAPTDAYNQTAAKYAPQQSNTGLEYAVATGLSAEDVRTTIPGRILNAFRPIETEPPATDDREFLKTNYSAAIKTRNVQKIAAHLKTIIRGYGGRIDSALIDEKNGRISFAIPKNNFEDFETELHGFIGERFITKRISEQNLLYEKRTLETNTTNEKNTLANIQKNKDDLVANHAKTLAVLNSRIATNNSSIAVTQEKINMATDTVQIATFKKNLAWLKSERARLAAQIADQKNTYTQKLSWINADLQKTERNLGALNEADQNLQDTVETVQGTITLRWLGIPELLLLLTPYNWIVALLTLLVLWFYRYRAKQA